MSNGQSEAQHGAEEVNLIKNVDAPWETAKGRVRQDLDTIQRNINGLQADLAALTKVVNTPDPVPAAVISASNQVTVPTGDFLSVVSIGSGLTGNGTPTNPLIASASGLILATSSGLTGAGTVASPLAVNPDGSTITINGSNQLVAAGGGGPVLRESRITITQAQILNLGSVGQQVIAAAASGFYHKVLWVDIQVHQGTAVFGTGQNASLYYVQGATVGTIGLATIQTFIAAGTTQQNFTQGQMISAVINTSTQPIPAGASVIIKCLANNTISSGSGASVNVTVGYVTLAAL